MATRRPLVMINGKLSQLSDSDTFAGANYAGSIPVINFATPQVFVAYDFSGNILAVNYTGVNIQNFNSAPAPAPTPAPSSPTSSPPPAPSPAPPPYPTVSNAVTWVRIDMAGYTSVMNAAPYGGVKHTRGARDLVTGNYYGSGGDFGDGHYGSGTNVNYCWDFMAMPANWRALNVYAPTSGVIPSRVDEAPLMMDTKRRRALLYPNNRWHVPENSHCITGHLMFFDVASETWSLPPDVGTNPANDVFDGSGNWLDNANPQLDPNGHPYPQSIAKWGVYDEPTDRFYIALADTRVLILEAETLAMVWPIANSSEVSPYTYYNPGWYQGPGCFDRQNRCLVNLKSAYDNFPSAGNLDPNAYKLERYFIDTGTWDYLTATNIPGSRLTPLAIDTLSLVADDLTGQYVLYGGGTQTHVLGNDGNWVNDENNVLPNNNLYGIPKNGGTWKEWLPNGSAPTARLGQQMFWEPRLPGYFEFGGIVESGSSVSISPEIYKPNWNAGAASNWPTWRKTIAVNTWGQLAATATLASVGAISNLVNDWGGGAWDDLAGTWTTTGTGHTQPDNSVYRISCYVSSPGFVQLQSASTSTANTDDDGVYPDGRPAAVHTYNTLVAVPSLGSIITNLSGTSPYGSSIKKAYLLDKVTGASSLLVDYTTVPGAGWQTSYCAACYDPRGFIWVLPGGASRIYRLNPFAPVPSGTDGGQRLFALGTDYTGYDNYSAGANSIIHIEAINSLILISGLNTTPGGGEEGSFGLINLVTSNAQYPLVELTRSGSFAPGFGCYETTDGSTYHFNAGQVANGTGIVGAAWDHRRNRLVLWSNVTGRTVISTLTPPAGVVSFDNWSTGTWIRGFITVAGGNSITPSVPVNNGTFSRFFYSATLDGVFVLNGTTEPMYFYALS